MKADQANSQIDLPTVEAVLNNKIRVFTHYTNEVLLPTFKHERKSFIKRSALSAFSKDARRAIKRHPLTLKHQQHAQVKEALAHSENLSHAYQLRERLNQMWSKTYNNNQELLESFQEWCHAAEKSGSKALQGFTAYLKSYRLKPAKAKK